MPTLPLDAFPLIAFALGTIGLIAAKVWSLSLDRKDKRDHAAHSAFPVGVIGFGQKRPPAE